MKTITLVVSLSLSVILPSEATAQEEALYSAPVPADAVFVRRLDDAGGPVEIMGRVFSEDEFEGQAYSAISAALLEGSVAGRHYSVTNSASGEPSVLLEPTRDDPARVYLLLVNASAQDAELVVAETGAVVIEATEPQDVGFRGVNPVNVELQVDTNNAAFTVPVSLRRGQNVTLHVEDGVVTAIAHTFGPVLDAN